MKEQWASRETSGRPEHRIDETRGDMASRDRIVDWTDDNCGKGQNLRFRHSSLGQLGVKFLETYDKGYEDALDRIFDQTECLFGKD